MAGIDTISILEGNTFVVANRRGDIEATPTDTHGLFHADTRYLSRWILTVDGEKLNPLSVDDLEYFTSQFYLVPGTGTVYVDSPMSVARRRAVGAGFHEDLMLVNHGSEPIDCEIRIEAAADFADLFEVKDQLSKKGDYYSRIEDGEIVLGYRRESFVRETVISASNEDAELSDKGLVFHANIPGHGNWTTCLDVRVQGGPEFRERRAMKYAHGTEKPHPNMGSSLETWLAEAPQVVSSWKPLEDIYRRSLVDLAALRYFPPLAKGSLPAAGLPWFMALFGRDSIITSLQAMPFVPELGRTTLEILGRWQGTTVNDFRDEEPGRILHEARMGELTAFEERPHSPYYGTSDATPLYVILLDEYQRWTGDDETVKALEPVARAAIQWIDEYGDRDGDGYIEYDRRNTETGLENQCWKDSWNSIIFANGELAPLPRATCELQGYAYDAKLRAARLAREIWGDPDYAARLESEAAELKERFNRDFWIPERKFFALALDRDKKKVDSLTSNIGHLLWSGIVDEDKAAECVRHLLGPELFSGWGVRTMGTEEGGYNPIGYHVGTVWPHDNGIIALGLRRYGYKDEAARIAMGILEAATYFDNRLPEAFAGYVRERTHFPVEYPTACSPQAWSTGAPLMLIRSMLGIDPLGDRLVVDPGVPEPIQRLELLGIPRGRWERVDAFGRGRIGVEGEAQATARSEPAEDLPPGIGD